MKQRILVLTNETHAHILPEGAVNLPLKTVVKDVTTVLRYQPSLKCFVDSPSEWVVEEHHVNPENVGVNPNNAKRFHTCAAFLINQLRGKGFKVV